MKVLLALDGSDPSLVARDLVAGLAWPQGTTIHVVGAYSVPIDWTAGVGSTMDWVGDVEDAIRDRTAEDLRTMSQPLVDGGLTVEREALVGRAADVIVEAARRIGADLIVTGSRGHGRLRAMLLGSVADEVTDHAPCPVLVARKPVVTRMVVATDGSGSAGIISDHLCRWGIFRTTPADVVAVAVPDSPAYELIVSLYTLGDERLATQRAEIQAQAGRNADEMVRLLNEFGISATPHVRSGDPAPEILAAAQDRGADLIVTGSRGLGGIDRLLLGSVARNILNHAHCSVLIVRTAGAAHLVKEA
jgi:nucleotide-binding universal stress UspA family protein